MGCYLKRLFLGALQSFLSQGISSASIGLKMRQIRLRFSAVSGILSVGFQLAVKLFERGLLVAGLLGRSVMQIDSCFLSLGLKVGWKEDS